MYPNNFHIKHRDQGLHWKIKYWIKYAHQTMTVSYMIRAHVSCMMILCHSFTQWLSCWLTGLQIFTKPDLQLCQSEPSSFWLIPALCPGWSESSEWGRHGATPWPLLLCLCFLPQTRTDSLSFSWELCSTTSILAKASWPGLTKPSSLPIWLPIPVPGWFLLCNTHQLLRIHIFHFFFGFSFKNDVYSCKWEFDVLYSLLLPALQIKTRVDSWIIVTITTTIPIINSITTRWLRK